MNFIYKSRTNAAIFLCLFVLLAGRKLFHLHEVLSSTNSIAYKSGAIAGLIILFLAIIKVSIYLIKGNGVKRVFE
jgi:Na+/H+-translocating membrane pyrophosphatase